MFKYCRVRYSSTWTQEVNTLRLRHLLGARTRCGDLTQSLLELAQLFPKFMEIGFGIGDNTKNLVVSIPIVHRSPALSQQNQRSLARSDCCEHRADPCQRDDGEGFERAPESIDQPPGENSNQNRRGKPPRGHLICDPCRSSFTGIRPGVYEHAEVVPTVRTNGSLLVHRSIVLQSRRTRRDSGFVCGSDGPLLRRGRRRARVKAIVDEEGFLINNPKTVLRSQSERQVLAGLVVNRHANVHRGHYDWLKAVLHDAGVNGPESANRGGHPQFRSYGHIGITW